MPAFTSSNANPNDSAILATSAGEGLHAETTSLGVAAVAAISLDASTAGNGAAIYGESRGGGPGLVSRQVNAAAVGPAVIAEVIGLGDAIFANVNNPNSPAAAIRAEHSGNKVAGFFKGDVIVTGDVSFPGMDCAEEFAVALATVAEPGTLMSMRDDGLLEPSAVAYDRRVVGVVAGAGTLRPGIVMGKGQHGDADCRPVALVGRAYCKVDADLGPIMVGDLLTSAPRPGHAMKSGDPARAVGAVIGKAMAPLARGIGLVPILIALQ